MALQLQLEPRFEQFEKKITLHENLFFIGSCFSTNITEKALAHFMPVAHNPHGILFDPISITKSLLDVIQQKEYTANDLFQHNELWHSWHHHGSFSNTNTTEVLNNINKAIKSNHQFLKQAHWCIITLGTAFQYQYIGSNNSRVDVANCHKVPNTQFEKRLLEIETIKSFIDPCYHQLKQFNPNIKFMFTVSPVRHLKDGIAENNRSKARLIEIAHHFANKFNDVFYFPAYELVNDVLRDYRFFENDFAHPTAQAIQYVWEQFIMQTFSTELQHYISDVRQYIALKQHRILHSNTEQAKQHNIKTQTLLFALKEKYNIDFN
jgi:hypothetical protein